MSNQSLGNRVQDELTRAVALKRLPDDVQARAEKLLDRIRKPVRVGLMGLPGSGKSTLLNFLVNAEIVPKGARLPTLNLTYGEEPKATCTLPDGSTKTLAGTDGREIAALSPAFVEMQMPLAALKKISVLEIVAPKDETSMRRACRWAAKRTDVAIWCTQAFNAVEQSLWAEMPDMLKDHGFLTVTKSDLLAKHGLVDKTIKNVELVASNDFAQIMPISTTQAIAARPPEGPIDKGLLRSAGGTALISAVLKQVEMGRQSAVDMADILLHQHAEALAGPDPMPAQGAEIEQEKTLASSESLRPEAEKPEAQAAPTVAESETPKTADASDDVTLTSTGGATDSNVVVLHPATRDAYEHALSYITDQCIALIDMAGEMGNAAPAKVMSKIVEHVQWLSDYLNENGDDADPALTRARDAAMDAADLVQLMQMEKRDSAAIEALSLLLQLKRELKADLAA